MVNLIRSIYTLQIKLEDMGKKQLKMSKKTFRDSFVDSLKPINYTFQTQQNQDCQFQYEETDSMSNLDNLQRQQEFHFNINKKFILLHKKIAKLQNWKRNQEKNRQKLKNTLKGIAQKQELILFEIQNMQYATASKSYSLSEKTNISQKIENIQSIRKKQEPISEQVFKDKKNNNQSQNQSEKQNSTLVAKNIQNTMQQQNFIKIENNGLTEQYRNENELYTIKEVNEQSYLLKSYYIQPSQQKQNNQVLNQSITEQPEEQQPNIPKGIQIIDQNTITLWNFTEKYIYRIIQYLRRAISIKHVIIYDSKFTERRYLEMIMNVMRWVVGVYIICDFRSDLAILDGKQYISLITNYSNVLQAERYRNFGRFFKFHGNEQLLNQLWHLNHQKRIKNISVQISKLGRTKQLNKQIEQINVFDVRDRKICSMQKFIKNLPTFSELQILTFTNIHFYNCPNLYPVYKYCTKLNTLIFNQCQNLSEKVILGLEELPSSQLKHFSIIGNQNHKKIRLIPKVLQIILKQTRLISLTLQWVQFVNWQYKKYSILVYLMQNLQKLQNLKCLTHLNLSGAQPILPQVLSFIHPLAIKKMRMLNFGKTTINYEIITYLRRFVNLRSLSVEYTQLDENDIVRIVSNMPNLQDLNIQGLNGSLINDKRLVNDSIIKYGLVTSNYFNKMKHKNLRYVNIYACHSFSNYLWQGFDKLECIRISEGLLQAKVRAYLQQKEIKILEQLDQYRENNNRWLDLSIKDLSIKEKEYGAKYQEQKYLIKCMQP